MIKKPSTTSISEYKPWRQSQLAGDQSSIYFAERKEPPVYNSKFTNEAIQLIAVTKPPLSLHVHLKWREWKQMILRGTAVAVLYACLLVAVKPAKMISRRKWFIRRTKLPSFRVSKKPHSETSQRLVFVMIYAPGGGHFPFKEDHWT